MHSKESKQQHSLEQLLDLTVEARLILGTCELEIDDILQLAPGATLKLEGTLGSDLELWVNNRLIAMAQTVSVGENVGAKIKEVSSREKRLSHMSQMDAL